MISKIEHAKALTIKLIQSMSMARFTEDLEKGGRDGISERRYLLIEREAFSNFKSSSAIP